MVEGLKIERSKETEPGGKALTSGLFQLSVFSFYQEVNAERAACQ